MNNTLFFQLLRAISICLLAICFILITKYTFIYLYPFLIAMLIAVIIHPVVSFIVVKWKITRGLATFFVMGSFFIFVLTTLYLIIKQLVKETTNLAETLPAYFRDIYLVMSDIGQTFIIPYYEKMIRIFPFLPNLTDEQFKKYIHDFIDSLSSSSTILIKNVVMTTSSLFSSVTYIGILFIFILISVYFVTKDMDMFKVQYVKYVPTKITQQLKIILSHVKKSVFGFIKAQIIITVASSIIVFIGLFIFRVENIFMITLTIFFVDFLPYVGIGVVFIPWIIYTFYTAKYVLTIQLAILYIVIIILRQIIEPKILADYIGIHPLIAIITLFIGIQSFGLVGIFITPIVLIVLSAIYHARIIHYVWYFVRKG